jgi:Uncharacterized protein conserved in bacteria (DUF2191).
MATNLAIDDNLIIDAKKIGGHKTKKEAVTEALEEYIKKESRLTLPIYSEKLIMKKDIIIKKGDQESESSC